MNTTTTVKIYRSGVGLGLNIPKTIITLLKLKEGDIIELNIKKLNTEETTWNHNNLD